MARTQSKKPRLFGLVKTSNSTSSLASSPGRSETRVGELASIPETSGMASPGRLDRMRRFFRRSDQDSSTTTATEVTQAGGVPQVAPDQDTAARSIGGGVQEHQRQPQAALAIVDTTFSETQPLIDTNVEPFEVFNQRVSTSVGIHPYAQAALGILISTSQLFLNQRGLDRAVSDLLDTVRSVYEYLLEQDRFSNLDKVALAEIARATCDAAHFIINYSATKSFWKRTGRHIFSETRTVVDAHKQVLETLIQQCRDRAARDIQVKTYRILEDLNIEGMTYAGGAGLNTTKKCLDGTRTKILRDIMSWIYDPDFGAPRILWLHGRAGGGTSAIAHTVASRVKDVGALGSCFCFARDRQFEHREEKIFATIARDLAGRDQSFRRALAATLSEDPTLKTTSDVTQQWQQLILEPLSKLGGTIVGSIVVVIDALDESGPDTSRERILSVLTSPEAAQLPSNFRILLTSRPLIDISRALSAAVHVKAISLDDTPALDAECDVQLSVSAEFRPHPEHQES